MGLPADLFADRAQLIVYHFMFHPDDKAGCPHCSLRADGFGGIPVHLARRDVAFVAASRAPYAKLDECRRRMGWTFDWVSSEGSGFNYDYQASFTPEEMQAKRAVYRTYSCYDRGNDKLNIHYHYLDLVPKGRDEGGRGPYWVKRKDEYPR